MNQKYENIIIPDSLDKIINDAIEKGEKKRRLRFIKSVSVAAALIIGFGVSVNTSSAFASYLSDIPGISSLVQLFKFDKGLENAAKKGYIQEINKSVEDNGIKMTVESVIYDGRRLIVNYKIKGSNEYSSYYVKSQNITINDSENTKILIYNYNELNCRELLGSSTGNIDIDMSEEMLGITGYSKETFPSDLFLKCDSIMYKDKNGIEKSQKGNWSIPFKFNKNINIVPVVKSINKKITHGEVSFTVKSLKIHPTVVDVCIKLGRNEKYKIVGELPINLLDSHKEKYNCFSIIPVFENGKIVEDELIYNFQRNYLNENDTFTLEGEYLHYVAQDKQNIVVDLQAKKFTNDAGLGVEFLGDKRDVELNGEKYDYCFEFKIKDKDVVKSVSNKHVGLGLGFTAVDENNTNVNLACSDSSPERLEKDYVIKKVYIKKLDKTTKRLKFNIGYIEKGMNEGFKVELK